MHHVYILYSQKLNKYYTGETSNLEMRLIHHNTGFYKNAFTSIADDWVLFYKIACEDIFHARKIEKHIKLMKSNTYILNLKRYPEIMQKLLSRYKT